MTAIPHQTKRKRQGRSVRRAEKRRPRARMMWVRGTIRYFKDSVYEIAETRMKEICAGFGAAFGAEIKVDLRNVFDVLMNDNDLSDAYMDAARDIVVNHCRGFICRFRHNQTRW